MFVLRLTCYPQIEIWLKKLSSNLTEIWTQQKRVRRRWPVEARSGQSTCRNFTAESHLFSQFGRLLHGTARYLWPFKVWTFWFTWPINFFSRRFDETTFNFHFLFHLLTPLGHHTTLPWWSFRSRSPNCADRISYSPSSSHLDCAKISPSFDTSLVHFS